MRPHYPQMRKVRGNSIYDSRINVLSVSVPVVFFLLILFKSIHLPLFQQMEIIIKALQFKVTDFFCDETGSQMRTDLVNRI